MTKRTFGWSSTALFAAPFLALVSGCGDADAVKSSRSPKATASGVPPQAETSASGGSDQPSFTTPDPSPSWLALAGTTGSSSQWGSGWLDLATPRDFAKGERLRLSVGGSADKILVRLLGKGMSPDSSRGLLGGTISVPENRVVEVPIDIDRKDVTQISVHGGPNPWNKQLGQTNGPATLEDIRIILGG